MDWLRCLLVIFVVCVLAARPGSFCMRAFFSVFVRLFCPLGCRLGALFLVFWVLSSGLRGRWWNRVGEGW